MYHSWAEGTTREGGGGITRASRGRRQRQGVARHRAAGATMVAMGNGRAVIEALVDAINAHDPDTACRLFHEDARVVTAAGRNLDRQGVHHLLTRTMDAFPDGRVFVDRWVVDGETV